MPHIAAAWTSTLALEDIICDDVLRAVMRHIEAEELIDTAAYVNRRWKSTSDCPAVWTDRIPAPLLALCDGKLTCAMIYARLYRFNLIQNGLFLEKDNCFMGSDGHRVIHWIHRTPSKGLSWELPLLDPHCSPIPLQGLKPFNTGAVASYNSWTEVVQVVDVGAQLRSRGLPAKVCDVVLAGGEVPLVLSLMVGGVEHTPSEYQIVALLLTSEDCEQLPDAAEPVALEQLPAHVLPIGHALEEDEQHASGLQQHMRRSGALQVHGPHVVQDDVWHDVRLVVNQGFKGRLAKVVLALRGRSERFVRGCCGAKFACAKLQYAPAQ